MKQNIERYPLAWPVNQPRTPRGLRTHSQFKRTSTSGGWQRVGHSMAECVRLLKDEIRRVGGDWENMVVSTNFKLRTTDGLPYSGQAQPEDVGAAVYFKRKGKDVVFACDKWNRIECNLYAIVKHVEAIRGQERWGVGSLDQAFRGYLALADSTGGLTWWKVLGTAHNATEDQVKEAYRELGKVYHPDIPVTGNADKWMEIRQAFDQAQALFKK